MNPLLNNYQRHYIQAYNSAHEVIQKLDEFEWHFSQLSYNDKNRLFEQIIAEQFSDYIRAQLPNIFFGPKY